MQSAKLNRKWNKIQNQYGSEMDQLLKQLWPEPEAMPLVYWDSSSLWDDLEMFGIVLVEDSAHLESLKGFWVDQETGNSRSDYWIPKGESEVPTITIDNPPTVDSAWDARPL